jgi:flagellar biogenesis protein FliO
MQHTRRRFCLNAQRGCRRASASLRGFVVLATLLGVTPAAIAQIASPTTNQPVDTLQSERPIAAPETTAKTPPQRKSDRAPEELGVGGVVEITSVGAEKPAPRSETVIPTELDPGTPIPPPKRASKTSATALAKSTSDGSALAASGTDDPATAATTSVRPARTLAAGAETEGTWTGQVLPTALALAATLGAILFARAVVKRVGGRMGGGKRPSGVVEVMARYPFARGHHIVLIKVGRRVLVTHQSAQGIQTLSEFTSPAEVADLIARCEAGARGSEQFTFDALLRGSEREFEGNEIEAPNASDRKTASRQRTQRAEFRASLPAAARNAEIETIDLTRRREVVR